MYVVAALLFLVWILGIWPFPYPFALPFVALALVMVKVFTD
ncbi:MAG: hypothetical protein ACREMD_13400 [Gemmatimonadota bacterium]